MEEEFRFYLQDTGARVLILPPDGLEEARRAAGDRVRILTIDMDAAGAVTPVRHLRRHRTALRHCADGRRRRARPAHERQHRPAQARAARSREPVHLGGKRRAQLRADRRRCVDVRDAVVPRARPGRLDARHALDRRHRRRPAQIQAAVVLARGPGSRRDVVLGGADAPPAVARARGRSDIAPARRHRAPAVHPVVQRVAAAARDACARRRLRRAGARGVRHDGSRASDDVQSAPAGKSASPDRSGAAPTCASASWTRPAASAPTASAARSSSRGRTSFAATRTTPRPTRCRSSTDGSAPATRAIWTPTATCGWSHASRS